MDHGVLGLGAVLGCLASSATFSNIAVFLMPVVSDTDATGETQAGCHPATSK